MSATTTTQSELLESVTGFDEIAVDKAFGIDLYEDEPARPMLVARAVVFIHRRREGDSDGEAKSFALGLTITDLGDYFADEPDEPVPDEPSTEPGKGDSEPVSEPTN